MAIVIAMRIKENPVSMDRSVPGRVAALAVLTLLAACGGGGDDGPSVPVEPTPLPTGPAASCFDSALVAAGARLQANYRRADGTVSSPPATGRVSVADEVLGTQASFNGVDGLVERRRSVDVFDDKNPDGSPPSRSSVETSYLRVIGPGEQTLVGRVSTSTAYPGTTTTVTWTPPVAEAPGRLQPGEAATLRYMGSARAVGGLLPGQYDVDYSQTTRFVGREWLQVPAGRFAACRFEVVRGEASSRTEVRSVRWVYRGVTLREEATTQTTTPSGQLAVAGTVTDELQSATVNGQALQ